MRFFVQIGVELLSELAANNYIKARNPLAWNSIIDATIIESEAMLLISKPMGSFLFKVGFTRDRRQDRKTLNKLLIPRGRNDKFNKIYKCME